MDLSQITAAQLAPEAQFTFDADALDKAILRGQQRRRMIRAFWANRAAVAEFCLRRPLRKLRTLSQPAARANAVR